MADETGTRKEASPGCVTLGDLLKECSPEFEDLLPRLRAFFWVDEPPGPPAELVRIEAEEDEDGLRKSVAPPAGADDDQADVGNQEAQHPEYVKPRPAQTNHEWFRSSPNRSFPRGSGSGSDRSWMS